MINFLKYLFKSSLKLLFKSLLFSSKFINSALIKGFFADFGYIFNLFFVGFTLSLRKLIVISELNEFIIVGGLTSFSFSFFIEFFSFGGDLFIE